MKTEKAHRFAISIPNEPFSAFRQVVRQVVHVEARV